MKNVFTSMVIPPKANILMKLSSRVGKIDIAFIENGQYDERWPNNHLFPEQNRTTRGKTTTNKIYAHSLGSLSAGLAYME